MLGYAVIDLNKTGCSVALVLIGLAVTGVHLCVVIMEEGKMGRGIESNQIYEWDIIEERQSKGFCDIVL